MKKTFFIIMILGFAVISFTNPIGELFKNALNSNKGIKMTMLNFESAQMDYEKALIESSNKKTLLSAEISMLNERSSYRKGQADFYSEIADAFFAVKASQIELEISQLQLGIVQNDYKNAKLSFEKGMISLNSLKDSEVAVIDAQSQEEKARKDYNDALTAFKRATGTEFADYEVKPCNYKDCGFSYEAFKENDLSLKAQQISLQLAEYDLQNLSSNSSYYEKRGLEIKLEISQMNLKNKEDSVSESYENALATVSSLYSSLQSSGVKLQIKQSVYEDSQKRFEKGFVSEKDNINQKISYMSAQKAYNENIKSYIKALVSLILNCGLSVGEAVL